MLISQLSSEETCPFELTDRERVIDLVHDLRQPLGSIDMIACYLDLRLSPQQNELREYILRLQDLVEEANRILCRAVEVKANTVATA